MLPRISNAPCVAVLTVTPSAHAPLLRLRLPLISPNPSRGLPLNSVRTSTLSDHSKQLASRQHFQCHPHFSRLSRQYVLTTFSRLLATPRLCDYDATSQKPARTVFRLSCRPNRLHDCTARHRNPVHLPDCGTVRPELPVCPSYRVLVILSSSKSFKS